MSSSRKNYNNLNNLNIIIKNLQKHQKIKNFKMQNNCMEKIKTSEYHRQYEKMSK
jgi:hypothetical protein